MKRTRLVLGATLLVSAVVPAPASALPSDLRVDKIARLGFPTGMQFTASGDRLFVNERPGRVRVLVSGRLSPNPVASFRTTTSAESGLLGLALHPKFEQGQPYLYVFVTEPSGNTDSVVRVRIAQNREAERKTIFAGMPAGGYHHGGILAFGPDGKLYVSNGEAHNENRAQDPRILGGKIYRLNDDGSIPPDNPFSGSPTFAYGIRNPFGLAFDPQTGLLWETENGPDAHDEVNLIERGRNYGWPLVHGAGHRRGYTDPVKDYVRIIVPTMAAFGGSALPVPYRGNFFHGSYGTSSIRRLTLTANRRGVGHDSVLHDAGDGVVGMTMGPDGLYYSTPDAVFRIRAAATPSQKPSTTPTLSPATTPTPSTTTSPATSSKSLGPLIGLSAVIALGAGGALLMFRMRRPPNR